MFWIFKWDCNGVPLDGSDDDFAGPDRRIIDAQSVVDGRLGRFGTVRFAHVQGVCVRRHVGRWQ